MIDIPIAKAIANVAIFFEFSDASVVDSDAAMAAMEQLASDLQALDVDSRVHLCRQLEMIASEYSGEQADFVLSLPESLDIAVGEAPDPNALRTER